MTKARERKKAIADYMSNNKCTYAEAAKIFGVSVATVGLARREYGSTNHLKEDWAAKRAKIIEELMDASRPMTDIAAEYGVTQQRIGQIYRRAIKSGMPIPKRGSWVKLDAILRQGPPKTLAEIMLAERLRLGLSQDQVAKLIGTTQNYYSLLERDRSDPRASLLIALAKIGFDLRPAFDPRPDPWNLPQHDPTRNPHQSRA